MMQSTSCECRRDLRQLSRHRRTRHDMTTTDVFHSVTSAHSDPRSDELGVGDIAVEIASIDLRAEVSSRRGTVGASHTSPGSPGAAVLRRDASFPPWIVESSSTAADAAFGLRCSVIGVALIG